MAPLCFAAVLLYIGAGDVRGHLARELARDGLRLGGTAVVSYGAAALLGAALADGILEAMITAVCGTILYAVARLRGRRPRAGAPRHPLPAARLGGVAGRLTAPGLP